MFGLVWQLTGAGAAFLIAALIACISVLGLLWGVRARRGHELVQINNCSACPKGFTPLCSHQVSELRCTAHRGSGEREQLKHPGKIGSKKNFSNINDNCSSDPVFCFYQEGKVMKDKDKDKAIDILNRIMEHELSGSFATPTIPHGLWL